MHTIIHIGAGLGTKLSDYLATGAQHIVLVEPLPKLVQQLRLKASQIDTEKATAEIHILEAAITSELEQKQLIEFNLTHISSLRPETGLRQLYPDLKVNAYHSVSLITPNDLIQNYAPHEGQQALLIVDAPGETALIVQALINSDQLKLFGQLSISVPIEPLYQNNSPAQQLLTQLEKYGYESCAEDYSDPNWPVLTLIYSPLKVRLQAKLQKKHRQLGEQQNKISQLEAENEQLKKLNAATNKRQEQLEEELNKAEKQFQLFHDMLLSGDFLSNSPSDISKQLFNFDQSSKIYKG
ncbi:hypothetical protein [Oceanisphaera sediminis]